MDIKGIWAIELFRLYEDKNVSDIKSRLFDISDVFIYLHEILAEKKVTLENKDIYSEQLIIKFHLQNLSIIELSEGYSIKSNFFKNSNSDIKFLDISSIITIVRSQYETLLMYQHLYVNPKNENQQRLRFDSWIMSSMLSRSSIFKQIQENVATKLANEQNSIDNLRESIKTNPEFKNLSEKQQTKLLEIGSGKLFKTWDTLFKESNFKEDGVFSNIYFIASVYAHSEGILALQLKGTKHLKNDINMKDTNHLMLYYSYIMTNIMIKNITERFPLVKERFDSLSEKIKFEINFNYDLSFK